MKQPDEIGADIKDEDYGGRGFSCRPGEERVVSRIKVFPKE
jgi:hypothetical protein